MDVYEVECSVEGTIVVRVLADSEENALRLAERGAGVVLEKNISRRSTDVEKIR